MDQPTPERIALFGGTFDPVHDGHLALAADAVALAGLTRVLFLPARQSPHKSGMAPGAGPGHRLEMLRRAVDGLPWAELSDWELRQSAPSYSWKTVLHFRQVFPGAELFWLLGADQWAVIDTWARPEILRENLGFLVYPRPPLPAPSSRPGWQARFLDRIHPANATALRAALAAGEKNPAHLPAPVAEYIQCHGLYRGAPLEAAGSGENGTPGTGDLP